MPYIGPSRAEQRVIDAKSMERFYVALAVYAHRWYGHLVSGILTVVVLAGVFIAVFSRETSRNMTDWVGFSPLWIVGAIVAVVVWSWLRTNWRLFRDARDDIRRLRSEINAMREGELEGRPPTSRHRTV